MCSNNNVKNSNSIKHTFKSFVMQFFCNHKWDMLNKSIQPISDGDTWVCCSRLHKCEKCNKEQTLSSGWY